LIPSLTFQNFCSSHNSLKSGILIFNSSYNVDERTKQMASYNILFYNLKLKIKLKIKLNNSQIFRIWVHIDIFIVSTCIHQYKERIH